MNRCWVLGTWRTRRKDTRMQRDLEDLQTENRFLKTPRAPVPVPLVRQAALTTTKVPWFNGSTSWEQYQQVFDAIVLSNGWGDVTAALQLLSHLQDDALSVALLIPMPLQASRKELTDALSSHYGSPGGLANYRREFDKTVRKRGGRPFQFRYYRNGPKERLGSLNLKLYPQALIRARRSFGTRRLLF